MDQYFWNAYKRLEHELLALADDIHICDDQLGVYSMKIGDLLLRAAIESEALSKVLYYANGGMTPEGRDLYFDTDCFALLEEKWKISKKTIYVTTPNFYLQDEENRVLKPLHKSYKRGSSSSQWQRAYQAVKHDRVHSLKKGNLSNLISAMGAIYILNIYYRNTHYTNIADVNGSDIDWGLGSELFSVKISPESDATSLNEIYQKKEDYDECIYLIKHTDETAQKLIDFNKEISEKAVSDTMVKAVQKLNSQLKSGELSGEMSLLLEQLQKQINENQEESYIKLVKEKRSEFMHVMSSLKLEAVLNKQQY